MSCAYQLNHKWEAQQMLQNNDIRYWNFVIAPIQPALYENCRLQKIKILPWLGSFFLIKRGKGGREPWEDQKNRLAVYRNTSYVSLTPVKLFIVKVEKCPSWHSFLPCCQGGGQTQDFPLHLSVSFYIQTLSKLLVLPQQRPWTFKAIYRDRPLSRSIQLSKEALAARTYLFAGVGLMFSVTEFTFHKRAECHCQLVSAKQAKKISFS